MSEAKVIKRTKMPNTTDSMAKELRNLGIDTGDTVLVHSSLSSIGWVCGDEPAVVAALLKAAGAEGTVAMPAHSGANSDPAEWGNPPVPEEWFRTIYENMPPFDPAVTPVRGIGRIPEYFRRYPGTLRSGHPQLSFCANGKHSRFITEGHVLTPQLGRESPLGKLYELKAKVLLLGCGYDSCTCFHMGEALNENMPKKRMGAAVLKDGKREWIWFEDFSYDSDDFEALGDDFEKAYGVIKGKVGNAACRLFDLREAVDFAVKWIREHRNL
ncbi:MAG: SPBc2 prophage-derived aminoglycoside N(3')-acetyltransferase-like protein YokD [Firmicutes bacterium ADurb.Bin182]|nr:MAG: SPBc2 prophage-derived aminoglycoside N(3')-acetyltransferase-like protein YokD [Firmicutes bacterium ADurb.Bin182]